jgi:hypothetical protein
MSSRAALKQPMRRINLTTPHAAQRGAATLVVVMVLFFIAALVSAYTSRNLIFEQRTSANQYRATQAFEAAEAGIEWALAMLNGGRIDADCEPHPLANAATLDPSFRGRYLAIDEDGGITAPPRASGEPRQAACVFNGVGWQCSCPADAAPALIDPPGPGPFPAFVLRFYDVNTDAPPVAYPPGVVRIESTGCTRLDAAGICAAGASSGDGRATVTILAALKSAIVTPAAAVTVRGDLSLEDSDALRAINQDQASGGLTLHMGGDIIGPMPELQSLPGTPPDKSFLVQDNAMPDMSTAAAADRMFTAAFGMGRDTYRLQPAAVFIDCEADCTASTVRDMALLNPGRVLWINGTFQIDTADPIGTTANPVVLVVTGDINITGPNAELNGVVYTVGANSLATISGDIALHGALIAEANLTLSSGATAIVEYDGDVLNRLRRMYGSFVRVPGSWKDF